jgi:hypothetical protein
VLNKILWNADNLKNLKEYLKENLKENLFKLGFLTIYSLQLIIDNTCIKFYNIKFIKYQESVFNNNFIYTCS